jgi:hypothetical protein
MSSLYASMMTYVQSLLRVQEVQASGRSHGIFASARRPLDTDEKAAQLISVVPQTVTHVSCSSFWTVHDRPDAFIVKQNNVAYLCVSIL